MYTQAQQELAITLFNCVVVDQPATKGVNTELVASHGVVTDGTIPQPAVAALSAHYQPLPIRTLFGRQERDQSSALQLIFKQVLHYVEVYGLNRPGLFELEVTDGVIVTLHYVQSITVQQLADKVRQLIYANAPVKDAQQVVNTIKEFAIEFDLNLVLNNELKVMLKDHTNHPFESGDDAVRYLCWRATGSPLLIKSQQTIHGIKDLAVDAAFFQQHLLPLAQVFNRHKPLILAAKRPENRTVINQIARMSKKHHVPIQEAVNKKFVALALKDQLGPSAVDHLSIRDKFKVLNTLAYRAQDNTVDAFVIRNGKIHVRPAREPISADKAQQIEQLVLDSLAQDLAALKDRTILLDPRVDYGLPVSRKQTVGNLPFGSQVMFDQGAISSGIYWHNDWGSSDLDLSCIDLQGQRTGWGQYSGYDKKNPIKFSGDVTSAYDGAMEFVTSSAVTYGLFVNIYSGRVGTQFELVVGQDSSNRWIKNVAVREKSKLESRGNIVGFVKDNRYVAYYGRINEGRWSSDDKTRAIVARGAAEFWTVKKLFDKLGIKYSVDKQDNTCYDYNMSYESFSYDKLEELLIS